MRMATIKHDDMEKAAIVFNEFFYPIEEINRSFEKLWETNLFALIQSGNLEEVTDWFNQGGKSELSKLDGLRPEQVKPAPLYRHPRKIWGIGLNYVEHASDLSEKAPSTEPASFMKPDTTIIGPEDTIVIPVQSERTTAEAELGVIIGKTCKDVSEEEAVHYVAGYTTIIDMTAEDILQRNPRYLTRSKSFDTFFSFGPQFVTTDEVDDVHALEVSTIINEELHRKNVVSNMSFTPWNLVSFHSKVMTMLPGDIISTGTPGAVPIKNNDKVRCDINGFASLTNTVKDLKA